MILDDQPAGGMWRITGSNLWFYMAQLRVGTASGWYHETNRCDFYI
jgi:hypothetical protein